MSEFSLSATLKGGTGYDAPWVVVYANDPQELKAKLEGVAQTGVLQATVEAANLLKGANNAGPLLQGGEQAQPPQQPAQQQAPAQPVQQSAWGQQPAQQAAPQQQQSRFGGQQHPEGRTCELPGCENVLELKKTQTGKSKWQCSAWRWNNGNPNGHTAEFI